jgi:uncharacterized membrane protein YdbT with pleckstrin-like domain
MAVPASAGAVAPTSPQHPSLSKPQPDTDGFMPLAQPESELPLVVTEFITQHLMPGERLIAVTRIHPMAMLAPSIFAALGLLLCVAGIVAGPQGGGFACMGLPMALLAGGAALALLLQTMTTEFSCTDRRILIKSGFFTTQLREMPLGKVEALSMQQGLFGKLFGYGTLVFKGSGGTRRTCNNIEAPFDYYKRVQEQVAAAHERK